MLIKVNGEVRDIPEGTTVADLVTGISDGNFRVLVDGRSLEPQECARHRLDDGSIVEILHCPHD